MLHTTCIQEDSEKSGAFPDSSNASPELKPGSGAVLANELDSNVADEKAPPGDQSEQVREITGVRWVLVVVSLYALDNTVVADVEPKIVGALDGYQLPFL